MKRLLRYILPTALAVVGLAAMALPASATNTSFTSEGCYGSGHTNLTGTNQITSDVSAWVNFTSTPCNWVYLMGFYKNASNGLWYGPTGPGWYSGGTTSWRVSNASGAQNVLHSSCNPGGPCSSAVYGVTQYP